MFICKYITNIFFYFHIFLIHYIFITDKIRKLVKLGVEQKITGNTDANSESTYQQLDFSKKSYDNNMFSNNVN